MPARPRTRVLTALAAGLVFAGAAPAFADEVVVDADTLTANKQATRSLGVEVAPGATLNTDASFTLACTGKNHVDAAQTVTLSRSSATLNGTTVGSDVVSATSATIGSIPVSWPDDATGAGSTNCGTPAPAPLNDNGNSGISITAPTTPGDYTVVVTWGHALSPAGNGDSNAINRSSSATYTFTVVAPVVTPPPPPADTTAPVISYTVNPAAPNGDNGWYKSGNVVLDWTVTENESNSSLVLTGCEDRTISVDQQAATYSCSASSDGGTAAQQSVTIKRDGTNPAVAIPVASDTTGTAGDNGWYTSDVNVAFHGSDATSGLVGPADRTVTLNTEGEGLAASSPAYTDQAGNTVAAGNETVSGINIDKTAPVLADPVNGDVTGTNGWYRGPVEVTFHGSDATSGLVGPADRSVTLSTDGAGQAANSPAYTDQAGNTVAAGNKSVQVNIDQTAPTVAAPVPTDVTGTSGTNGWYTSDVNVAFHGSDATSRLVGDADRTVTLNTEGQGLAASSPAYTDQAGNTVAAGNQTVSGIKIDKTAPTNVSFSSALSGSYSFGTVPQLPTCAAEDTVSGVASCQVTGYGTSVGTHTLTATATNGAGLTRTATTSYTVAPYTTRGFHQPVDGSGVFNTAKAGSTVPLKFEVFAGANFTSELSATNIASIKAVKANCVTSAAADEVEVLASGSTVLRWDSISGQYVFNWKTPAAGCYKATVYLNDLTDANNRLSGTAISANFRLR